MPKHKSLLIGIRWVSAGRSRKCYHSASHSIAMGDPVLEVKVGLGWQGYCRECAAEMIVSAVESLERLRDHYGISARD
jgi:hypothetical protein